MTIDHVPAGPLDTEPLDAPADQHAALLATLTAAGVELGAYDRRIAEWLAASPGMGWGAVATIASWVKRAAEQPNP
ncbi:hypothetical protein ACFY6Q_32565 [[Kitasatospora] papulosa]|uniref:hypothetical protein n=1 Tax=[Kitasatospora] papulosa TaxID=1464011 RepID=UPI00369FE6E8